MSSQNSLFNSPFSKESDRRRKEMRQKWEKESKKRREEWDRKAEEDRKEFDREANKHLAIFTGLGVTSMVLGTATTLGICYGVYKVISLFV
jgi:hypothetical protein